MSHRDDCPSRWDAEREGRRAFEWGRSRSSNPHESIWHDEGCPEAADAWRSGYRRAEMCAEEEREEEAARQRAAARRAYELEEESYYLVAREAEERAYCESVDEPRTTAAVDPIVATERQEGPTREKAEG